ncbi:ADP-ribosylglycohydrolase family protein [Streptomyces sp. MS2A]|nr:ADP-ribosylglycohydrolase family protein [Streptomyces sp. MS2A]
MSILDAAYAERVYAGVLGKLVGVYLGRPVEGWPYGEIQRRFGLVDRYVCGDLGLPLIVADDDISGTLAFGRSVEDHPGRPVRAGDVGQTWLNYIIEDRTILWWGGYGRSTEHTAFLNLRRGMGAPASGSIAVNGTTLAEQIGAQIFSDAFALMHPGDPRGAAVATREAASVSHDGVALDAASFFAAMRAQAFLTADLDALIETGRRHVSDGRLLGLIDEVVAHVAGGDDWREVRDWVDARYGYAHYPGPCHALSNTAMVLASLLLAGDDFRLSVAVASSVGFDTDSNAGTVGCLNGVRLGLSALPTDLREPVADRAIVVSADGGEAVTDAAIEAARIVASARGLRGEGGGIRSARLGFPFPGARHGFTACPHRTGSVAPRLSDDVDGGLRIEASPGDPVEISTPTFLDPLDRVGNFSMVASPTLYPTDVVSVALRAEGPATVRLFALYEADDGVERRYGDPVEIVTTRTLTWSVPAIGNLVPFRLGIEIGPGQDGAAVTVKNVDWDGAPAHFAQGGLLLSSIWDTAPAALAPWVSSARNWEADFEKTYCVSHPDEGGVVTIGTRAWRDYSVRSTITLSLHESAGLVVRARGHRNYSGGIFSRGRALLIDQIDDERRVLAEVPYPVRRDVPIEMTLTVVDDELTLVVGGETVVRASTTRAVEGGGAGFLVERGTFTADGFLVRRRDHTSDGENRKATA